MRHPGLLAAGLAGALLFAVVVGWAVHLPLPRDAAPPFRRHGSSAWSMLPGATDEQRQALASHIHTGAPIPAGFELVESLGDVDSDFTGRVDPATGARELAITVQDYIDDLEEARFVVDGVLQATATRANGGIADREAEGLSVARLAGWIPRAGHSYSAAVEWDTDPGGPTQQSTFTVRVRGPSVAGCLAWLRARWREL
jgi:hypothetical protein